MEFKSNYLLKQISNGWILSYPKVNPDRGPGDVQAQFILDEKFFQGFPAMIDFVKIHQEQIEKYTKANTPSIQ